ncbi:Fur family transcriptional regulator [Bacillus taeanensis]|uniref:Transcriptional repressor n=1 Tax=Bacillus taeanensis TaxID=273032 RepID=A0A366Y297_9BACI|nr:Fur family transcriptional regulator [Bacillus taeanensis]RBW70533.1 transcriptional repressor [Bacillus taeanensis]
MNVITAMEILRAKGYKHTDKRKDLLELFAKEKRYLTAKEVLEAMKPLYPGLSFDTIYRNLSLFDELEIIEVTELEGEKRYRFGCATNDHHHHLICLTCGKTKHVHVCPMNEVAVKKNDFYVTGHKFEVYGYCANCME